MWTRHRIADAEYPCHRRDLAASADRPRCERKDEHLDRGCRNCGHRWSADVLDREPASGAGSDEASRALSVSTPKAEMRDARERLESPCEKTGRDMVRLTAALGMEIGEWPQFVDEMVAKIGALKDVFRAATELRLACVTDGETHQRVRNIEVRALCSALDALDDRPAAQSRKNGATFADAIRSALSTRGMTQADLAAVVGSAPSVVSRALADGANPTLDTVTVYARAVGLRVAFVASESTPAPTGEAGDLIRLRADREEALRAAKVSRRLHREMEADRDDWRRQAGDFNAEANRLRNDLANAVEGRRLAEVTGREAARERDGYKAEIAAAKELLATSSENEAAMLREIAARDEQIAGLTKRLEGAEALRVNVKAMLQGVAERIPADSQPRAMLADVIALIATDAAGQRLADAAKTETSDDPR
jgi:transcriptional regulator with XRE-family HTH domain